MYKKALATGGIISSLLFTGGMAAYAQNNTSTQAKSGFRQELGKPDASKLAAKFGLDATKLQAEIEAGKKLPDILEEHGITRDKMVKLAKHHKHRRLEKALDMIAPKLGLHANDIRAELDAGKTFHQVLTENGITKQQVQETLGHRGRMERLNPHFFHGRGQKPAKAQ